MSYKTYALCLYLGGYVGAHDFYTGNTGAGLKKLFTANSLLVGWVKDMIGARRKFNQEMMTQGILGSEARK